MCRLHPKKSCCCHGCRRHCRSIQYGQIWLVLSNSIASSTDQAGLQYGISLDVFISNLSSLPWLPLTRSRSTRAPICEFATSELNSSPIQILAHSTASDAIWQLLDSTAWNIVVPKGMDNSNGIIRSNAIIRNCSVGNSYRAHRSRTPKIRIWSQGGWWDLLLLHTVNNHGGGVRFI